MIAYFVADVHLGRKSDGRFLRWLHKIRGEVDHLFLVGDIFDFYFEYHIPEAYNEVMHALTQLMQDGTKVYYVLGNHEMYPWERLKSMGLWVGDHIAVDVGTHKVFVAHNLEGLSWGQKFILRSKTGHLLSSIVPRATLFEAGLLWAKTSCSWDRLRNRRRMWNKIEANWAILRNHYDVVVVGHYHTPCVKEKDGRKLIILPVWTKSWGYLKYENGEWRLIHSRR